jgi:CheY-like chemotaxis protein
MIANSVDAALALCRRTPPHLVVSDIRLGSSDGFALIETIRQYNREYRGYTPAIALTGFVTPGDKQRAMAAGFNAYIHKPFDPMDLVNTISSLLQSAPGLAA